MDKKKLLAGSIIIIIVLGMGMLLNNTFRKPKDLQLILEDYYKHQYNENIQIEIFDTVEIHSVELVGFTIAGTSKCAFAVIEQKVNSSYRIISLDPFESLLRRGLDIYVKHIDLHDDQSNLRNYLVILSMNPDLSKIEKTVKGIETSYYGVSTSPSMTVLDLSLSNETEYNFYDSTGNLIR